MRFLFKIEYNKLSLLWSNISLFTQISLVGLSTFLHSSELFVLHKHFSARLRQRQLWILFLFALSTLTYHRIVNSSQTDGVMLNWKQIKPGMHLRQRLLKPPPTTVNRSTPAVGSWPVLPQSRCGLGNGVQSPHARMLGCCCCSVTFRAIASRSVGACWWTYILWKSILALLIATCMRLPARGQGSCGYGRNRKQTLAYTSGFCNNVATTYV